MQKLEELVARFARQRHILPKEAEMIFRRDLNAWMADATSEQLSSLALGIAAHIAMVKTISG